MEPTLNPNASQTPAQPTSTPPKSGGSYGGIIAIVIILIVVVVGALYFWGERIAKSPSTDSSLEAVETQSESTEPAGIQSDLEAQTPEAFDAEFDAAFGEIDAAFDAE